MGLEPQLIVSQRYPYSGQGHGRLNNIYSLCTTSGHLVAAVRAHFLYVRLQGPKHKLYPFFLCDHLINEIKNTVHYPEGALFPRQTCSNIARIIFVRSSMRFAIILMLCHIYDKNSLWCKSVLLNLRHLTLRPQVRAFICTL